nr:pyruvate kinase [Methylacidimicrobium sp. AP8]
MGAEVPARLLRSGLPLSPLESAGLLEAHTAALLGPKPRGRNSSVMVTMPAETAQDPELARRILEAGMDIARIHCAHDSESVWARMVENLRRAARERGRTIRILMDLAGPEVEDRRNPPGAAFLQLEARASDRFGRLLAPARIPARAGIARRPHARGDRSRAAFPRGMARAPGSRMGGSLFSVCGEGPVSSGSWSGSRTASLPKRTKEARYRKRRLSLPSIRRPGRSIPPRGLPFPRRSAMPAHSCCSRAVAGSGWCRQVFAPARRIRSRRSCSPPWRARRWG